MDHLVLQTQKRKRKIAKTKKSWHANRGPLPPARGIVIRNLDMRDSSVIILHCHFTAICVLSSLLLLKPLIEYVFTVVQEEEILILPALTAPALLQTNSRPKRGRGPTLDYKAMHEGKQNQPKRGK
jgi:hypothetical protein